MNLNSTALRKVLPLLALRPGEGHTLTDLMRFAALDSKSVSRVLDQLRNEGVVAEGLHGPRTYSVDPSFSMYPEIKVIALRLLDFPAKLREAGARADLVLVYGSLLRPTFGRESDIDVLVVSDNAKAVRSGAAALEEKLGKHISPQIYSRKDFANSIAVDPFVKEVLERPHAVLADDLDRFGVIA